MLVRACCVAILLPCSAAAVPCCCCRLRKLVADGKVEQLQQELQRYKGKSDVKSHLKKVSREWLP
jgi:hypothetical protein